MNIRIKGQSSAKVCKDTGCPVRWREKKFNISSVSLVLLAKKVNDPGNPRERGAFFAPDTWVLNCVFYYTLSPEGPFGIT